MVLLRRRRLQPLLDSSNGKRYPDFSYTIPHGSLSSLSVRSQATGLITRVSSMFNGSRKKNKSVLVAAGVSHIAVKPSPVPGSRCTGSRCSSPASSYHEDIRRPSGLGRRLGSGSDSPLSSTDTASARSGLPVLGGGIRGRSRCISSPELSRIDRRIIDWDALDQEVAASSVHTKIITLLTLPRDIMDVILSFLSRSELAKFALVSRRFSPAVHAALYSVLDLREIPKSCIKQLLAVLATRQRRLDIVRTLICRSWPTSISSRIDPQTFLTTPPLPTSKFAIALSNMRHLTSLTLPSFEIRLLRYASFRLRCLTFFNKRLSQEDFVELFIWLSGQPDLTFLSFPNLLDDNIAPGSSEESYSPSISHATPSIISHTQLSDRDTHAADLIPRDTTILLPSLERLTANQSVVAQLVPMHALTHVAVNIHSTLYTGLRPSTLLGMLNDVPNIGLRFGENVDRRSVDKTLRAVGAVLGDSTDGRESRLKTLDIEMTGSCERLDETIYRAIHSILPRLGVLHGLHLRHSSQPPAHSPSPSYFSMPPSPLFLEARSPTLPEQLEDAHFALQDVTPDPEMRSAEQLASELAQLAQWTRQRPTLRSVVFPTGGTWRLSMS